MNNSYASPLWAIARQKPVVAIVAVATLLWSLGLPFSLFPTAHAANLGILKDTITDSGPSVATNHVITFQATTTLTSGNTIKVQFDPATDAFNISSLVFADLSATGMTIVAGCTGGPTDEVTVAFDASAPDENVIFTVCGAGDTITGGIKTITFGNSHVTNPASEGSYVVRMTYGTDGGDTRIAVINHVTLTASVDTTLTFTITGVAIGSTVNGDATTTASTTTAVLMPFGTLASGTINAKTLAQDLSVTTNARNGFVVTVIQNQNLLSSTGADIDLFKDGNANPIPTAWTSPLATLGSENTYGHYGITSEDADLNGDEFGTALYAGNFGTTTRQVFSHNGPSDGVTANIGLTRVGVKIQVSALQEAGNDYTNQLIYVCTPTF